MDDVRLVAQRVVEQDSASSRIEEANVAEQAARMGLWRTYEAAEQAGKPAVESDLTMSETVPAAGQYVGQERSYDVVPAELALPVEEEAANDLATLDEVVPEILVYSDQNIAEELSAVEVTSQVDLVQGQGEKLGNESPEEVTWADVLQEEPLVVYADFTEALHTLVTVDEMVGESDAGRPVMFDELDERQPKEEAQLQSGAVPAIALAVVEHLADAVPEEREVVAPALEGVVVALRAVEVLKSEETDPEHGEVAVARLEEQVRVLLEQLGVAYEAEGITRFALLLLRPNFQPVRVDIVEDSLVDIEHDGVHEAKRHITQLVSSGTAKLEDEAERLLGKFVLLRSLTRGQHLAAA
jgi:hypothetical protein